VTGITLTTAKKSHLTVTAITLKVKSFLFLMMMEKNRCAETLAKSAVCFPAPLHNKLSAKEIQLDRTESDDIDISHPVLLGHRVDMEDRFAGRLAGV
jgi:hypothetical protein